jgi:YD repeat-containing protein
VITATSELGRANTHTITNYGSDYSRTDLGASGGSSNYSVYAGTSDAVTDSTSYSRQWYTSPDARFGNLLPFVSSEYIARGWNSKTITRSQSLVLNTPSDPFSIDTFTQTTSVNGKMTTHTYTGSTKTLVTTSPVGRVQTRVIDTKERTTSLQHASYTPFDYTYDSNGRLIEIAQGSSRVTTLAYDSGTGFLDSITNPLSQTRSYAYDLSGRVTSETLPDSRVISYDYDANGNLASVTPPGRSAHTLSYNGFDLLSSYIGPTAKKALDLLGVRAPVEGVLAKGWSWLKQSLRKGARAIAPFSERISESVAAVTGPQTDYTYNDDRQLTQILRPDGQTIDFSYSSTSRDLETITLPVGSRTFGHTNGARFPPPFVKVET